jgi:hypothetical protein
MSSTSDSVRPPRRRAFTRLVVTLLVFALLGAVGFLLAQLNARTFTLQQQDGKLLVMKGRMLPVGSDHTARRTRRWPPPTRPSSCSGGARRASRGPVRRA